MKTYITIAATRARNKPGGAGWDMGAVSKDVTFSSDMTKDGWIMYAPNRWIPISAVKPILIVEPDGRTVINIRTSTDGGQTFDAGKFYEEV